MQLDAGYLTIDDMPLGPRVFTDGLFEGRAEPLVAVLGSSDAALSGSSARLADGVPADPLADVAGPLGVAEDAHQANVHAGDGNIADGLIGSGENVEELRQSVLRFLPPPDTSPDLSFSDPPTPPAHYTDPSTREPPPPRDTGVTQDGS